MVNKFLTGKEIVYQDVTKISDYKTFFEGLNADDELVLCGGDGTLNRFINSGLISLGESNNFKSLF